MAAQAGEQRIDVLGVAISETTYDGVLETVERWIQEKQTQYVCFTPVSGIMAAERDPSVREALNGAGLTVPDGMPLVWAARHAGTHDIERVYGPDLMAAACEVAQRRGWRCFLYGGGAGVAPALRDRLQSRFPKLKIAGIRTPPYRPLTSVEMDEIASEINESQADLVWVGLSTPKQDLFMAGVVSRLSPPAVLLGVGAAFDIHAGLRRAPPRWLGPLGLFWLYRVLQEPRRLGRRYAVDVPQFLFQIARRRPVLLDRAPN